MEWIALAFGVLLTVVGFWGAVMPQTLIAGLRRIQTQAGLYTIAALRLVFGTSLLWVAEGSLAPLVLYVLGGVALFSGLATPFFGVERFRRILNWWSQRSGIVLRLWCALASWLGVVVIWALGI